MQIQDCDRPGMTFVSIPAPGPFRNRHRSVSERVYRLLERLRLVPPRSWASSRPTIRLGADSAQQVLKTRIGAQRIGARIDAQ